MIRSVVLLTCAAACAGGHSMPKLDGGTDAAAARDADPDAPPDAPIGAAAYRHPITIDGTDDFAAADTFATTSAGYVARISWDDDNVYLGYSGPDLDPSALDTQTKWLFAALDLDPGAGTGATSSLTYNTQHAVFPAGFGAELYARWKCDASFHSLEQDAGGGTWTTSATTLPSAHTGSYVELAIPRSVLGTSATIGVVTWMINEKPTFEGSFAGLYAGNFTDGYAASLPITKYLQIDFASPRAPNDAANAKP